MKTVDDPILVSSPAPGVQQITLNRPSRLNALNPGLIIELTKHLDSLVRADDVKVVVLTGAGRGFCSGADLSGEVFPTGVENDPNRHWAAIQSWYSGVVARLRRIPQPVIAAVNGPAVGGGFSIAMASDIRLAAPEAYFSAAQINIGQSVSEMGASYLLPRIIGGRATEILMTGRRVQADEAERIGFVSRICPDGVVDAAVEVAQVLAAKAPLALRMSKEALNASQEIGSLEAALTMEDRTQVVCVLSQDLAEGELAFRQKRKAVFSDALVGSAQVSDE
ncbi:enoyl-CoA hydratase [Rhodococcus sp. OK611]|jgi:enoyl-CoA hydratase|uniref:enoyl-CoA hydratase/isomerase family protein n=1 Tax=unclassified Rhodococcus (in: high G+C Gram-positive bacteria) TaxID=192944 RepID=UPI000BCE97EF|nr:MULTISPECIES: enoyl-CoA hydratase-related protein [unclassified Rhodococcus (in: high G+C Gram-positive bacteria)]PTR44994.1 enoyl-CoA hydratase [Rhodococcus sp. OK611]SNX89329.1 enoyl-CoA hydratase [Rhodococcus sp. OK270]